ERHEAFGLVADIDDHLVADDLDHSPLDDAADLEVLAPVGEITIKIVLTLGAGDHGGQLIIAHVEFAKQVAIYPGCSFRSALRAIAENRLARHREGATGRAPCVSCFAVRVANPRPAISQARKKMVSFTGKKPTPPTQRGGLTQKVILRKLPAKTRA